jgi:parallel beta-helix repeat protein
MILVYNGQPVKAGGAAVYILPDGSLSPSSAPVARNGDVYTLTGDITTSADGIWVEKDNVILDGAGYTVQGGHRFGTCGVYLESRNNVTIRNFNIAQFEIGVWFDQCSNCKVSQDTVSACDSIGVDILSSSDIIVMNNTLVNNAFDGVDLYSSENSRIESNCITENVYNGISLVVSKGNYVCGNKVTANGQLGVNIYSGSNNSILANELTGNLEGLQMSSAWGNTIIGNNITSNAYCGIMFYGSDKNTVAGNTIANNNCGISLSSSSGNTLCHNNFVNNSQQVNVYSSTANVWDQGYPTGGNYWSDYNSTDIYRGTYQNETGSDGIGDTPYTVSTSDVDAYPLIQQTTATVCIYPLTATFEVGQVFSVSLLAFHPVDLWAWQAGLQWNPAVLECASWGWGEFGTLAGVSEQSPPVIDGTDGTFSRPALESTLRGTGASVSTVKLSLLTITFKIVKAGKCELRLTNVRLISQNSTAVTSYQRWSDTNNDGTVDVGDVRLAYNCWEAGGYDPVADFDGNGKVDVTDLSVVTSDLGKNSSSAEWGVTNILFDLRVATVGAQVDVPPAQFLLNVPYHHQTKSYYCGPAALEEVFNYYGPDIPQIEIADAARTSPDGTYTLDMVRAAHFSNLSTSVGSESRVNYTGYTARQLGYAALEYGGMTIEELKSVIAAGYPVIVLTTWHFRVAVGYDNTYIIFQDPYYGSMYRMTYDDFSTDWDYSGHWALLVSPWHVDICNPRNVLPGDRFNVTATITYPWVSPFLSGSPLDVATAINATITLPAGLCLVPGETTQKALDAGSLAPGQSFTVTWNVYSQALGNYRVGVEAEGLVNGFMPPLPPNYPEYTYEDRIGGTDQSIVAVTSTLDESPPITTEDYDGSWQNHAFTVNLNASDDVSGVLNTYYRINNGPEKTLSLDGKPLIATPGENSTLEYWSVDWAGNEELPHKFLTGIKLDNTAPFIKIPVLTPAAEVQPGQDVKVTVNASDSLSGIQNVTIVYTSDNWTTQTTQAMTLNASTSLYEAVIPGRPAGTWVRFNIRACDQAGNTAVGTNLGADYVYRVVPLCASVVSDRETLNLGFQGQWLFFCIELPEGYDVNSIDTASVSLCGTIMADPNFKSVGRDQNGVPYLMVCFNRTLASQFILRSGIMTGNVTLSLNGRLDDGSMFEGVCTLTVRMRGDVNLDSKVDMKDIAAAAKAFGSYGPNYLWYNATSGQYVLIPDASPRWNPLADENEDNKVNMMDVALIAKNLGKTYP